MIDSSMRLTRVSRAELKESGIADCGEREPQDFGLDF
jgi:hypothetical protein